MFEWESVDMYVHNINPTLLNLGPLEIRWYGIVYVLGFLLVVWWMQYLHKKEKLDFSKDEIWDFVFYLMVGVIVGARVFMAFFQPETFLFKPWNLLRIWDGGMSFHGGFVGAVVAGWLYCRKKDVNFWKLADVLCVPAIFALALGRIANFINGELWGRIWNGSWCVNFKNTGGGDVCRHPSVIYAAVKRFIVFGWLAILTFWKEFKPGFIFWNFVFFEGLGRIIVDFYREDPLFAGFSLGQWFSLAMVLIAGYVVIVYYKQDLAKIFKRQTTNSSENG